MSLRGRLSRLGVAPPEPRPRREALLDDLRARMRRVIERTERPRPPPPRVGDAPATEGRLPFFTEETPLGLRHRRVLRLSAAHRTGRAPTRTARHADAMLLSLLAFDESLASVDFSRALYLDTETTGLSGGTGTVAFLVGLASADADGLFVEQLIVRNLGEEPPMLAYVAERIHDASALVTFNGKTFDMPLLRTRFAMARLPPPPDRPHLDLMHVAQRVHRSKHRLVSLEEHILGFVREGDVGGGEVCARYLHFLRTGNEAALLGVVEHNAQDVITMLSLVGLYGQPLEPDNLRAQDLVGVAKTVHRAGESRRAFEIATLAEERGGGALALRARADIARALGDRDRALADLEAVIQCSTEDTHDEPRLALAKLYEHYVKEPARALALVEQGVAEDLVASSRRRARLVRKVLRQQQMGLFVRKS